MAAIKERIVTFEKHGCQKAVAMAEPQPPPPPPGLNRVKTKSTLLSLALRGHVTRHTTVKWTALYLETVRAFKTNFL